MRTFYMQLIGISTVCCVFVFGAATVSAYTFSTDLSVGSTGEDVRQLQRVLNLDAATRVAVSGEGSTGLETTYFGSLTQDAVVRFQTKYASEVLTPAGKTSATGVADVLTRSKLTKISNSAGLSAQNQQSTSGATASTTVISPFSSEYKIPTLAQAEQTGKSVFQLDLENVLNWFTATGQLSLDGTSAATTTEPAKPTRTDQYIEALSSLAGEPGDTITATGGNLPSKITAHIEGKVVSTKINSKTRMSLTFRIPDIDPGQYAVQFYGVYGKEERPIDSSGVVLTVEAEE